MYRNFFRSVWSVIICLPFLFWVLLPPPPPPVSFMNPTSPPYNNFHWPLIPSSTPPPPPSRLSTIEKPKARVSAPIGALSCKVERCDLYCDGSCTWYARTCQACQDMRSCVLFANFSCRDLLLSSTLCHNSKPRRLSDPDKNWLNLEVDLQSLFGLHGPWCAQLYSLAETPQTPPPPPHHPAVGLGIRGRYIGQQR